MDWQSTCRVCMDTGDMVSLFDCDENNEQLADKYAYCCGVQVTKRDKLPTLICLTCVDWMTSAYQFKRHCLTSNQTLSECLEEFNKVEEEPEPVTMTETVVTEYPFELPLEDEDSTQWTRTILKTSSSAVVIRAPPPFKKGPKRKCFADWAKLDVEVLSPGGKKKNVDFKREANERLELKYEQEDSYEPVTLASDDDNQGQMELAANEEVVDSAPEVKQVRKSIKRRKKRETTAEEGEQAPAVKAKKKYKPAERKHICETCNSAFPSNAALQQHIRRHLNIKPFVCSVCGFACVARDTLRYHMQRHTGEKPYQCRYCERRFGDYGSRQKHERVHTGVRPYKCTVCEKSFGYSYVLANHMLTHTGERNYACDKCRKTFVRPAYLKQHIKVFHKDLYRKMQLEQELKKAHQLMQARKPGVISAKIVDGTMKFVEHSEDAEQKNSDASN